MGMVLSVIVLGLAVSIDNFGTGMTYGLRKVRIPFSSVITIGICSAISLFVGLMSGYIGSHFLNSESASKLGGVILIGIGLYTLYNFFKKETVLKSHSSDALFHWEIKSFGIVINIMRKPLTADFDGSGSINGFEAVFLGIALSLDAFAVGISSAFMQLSYLPLIITTFIMSTAFLQLGIVSGSRLAEKNFLQKLAFLPGVVLILIGLMKL